MTARTFDSIEKIVKSEGVSGVLFALMGVIQDIEEQELYEDKYKKQAGEWRKVKSVVREAIGKLSKSPGIK